MRVESFLKIVEEIEYSCLSAEQQESMITKIADLSRFIESYDPSIEIVDCMRYKMNIVKGSGTRNGIVFCDHAKLSAVPTLYSNANLLNYKIQEDLEEIWLVHVTSCACEETRSFLNYIIDKSLDKIYDKIFTLDFLRSQVQTIK